MTENTDTTATAPTPAPAPTARPPLRRSASDRVLAGVAGGIAEWLGIDPVIVRVVLVVLAVFGGSGVVLYGIGWLFIPDASGSTSEAERFIAKGSRPGSGIRTALIVGAAVVATIVVLNLLSSSNGLWLLSGGGSLILLIAVGALVLWLVNRDKGTTTGVIGAPSAAQTTPLAQQEAPTSPSAPVVAAPAETIVAELPAGFAYGGSGQYPGYVPPTPVAPAPRKARSYLGLAVLSVSLLVMGAMASITASGLADIPAVVTLASGMGVLGIGLLIGAVAGRAKWLMWFAVPLLMITAAVSVIPANLHLSGMTTIGDRKWVILNAEDAAAQHSLTMGNARIDLTKLAMAPGSVTPLKANVGIGKITVIAPPGMRVNVSARTGIGTIRVEGLPKLDGTTLTWTGELPGDVTADAPTVNLDVQAGLGDVEVRRA